MSSALNACLLLLCMSLVTGYGTNGHFNDAPVFPTIPLQPQMLPPQAIYPEITGIFPMYQNEAPFMPSMWPNMHMQQASFFHPPGCDLDLPFHQNLHFLGSPFMNQEQWKQNLFQRQRQWNQRTFQNEGQGQWKQTTFQNQGNGQWKQPPFQNQGNGQWKQSPFQNQGNGQWKQPPFRNQGNGQWKQTPFQNQGNGQWKQTPFQNQGQNHWNTNQNVNMIGQWDGIPVNDQMFSQPAISSSAPKGTELKQGPLEQSKTGSQTVDANGFDGPIQSRRL